MPEEQKSFRISTASGHRQYLCNGRHLPSVTTVLSNTETAKSKASLANWLKNNPDKAGEAAKRGTHIHEACERYIRGLPVNVLSEYANFWQGLPEILDYFDDIVWSERPLIPEWNHLRTPDKELAFVWSDVHRYAGTPDLLGEIGGVKVIGDFKTSNGPYRNSFPPKGDKQGFGGYRKYTKCAQQLAAYSLAMEERTGWKAEAAVILVTTEEITQAMFIDANELKLHESRFLKRAEQYHQLFDQNGEEISSLLA